MMKSLIEREDVADVFCDNARRLIAEAGGPGRTS